MLRIRFIAVLILFCPLSVLLADDHSWSLDSADSPKVTVHGTVTRADGTTGRSAVLDGESLLKVKDSERLTSGEVGFTLTAWVNPYLLGVEQQMIAAKNRYSLGERQWGVMIDNDNRFRLYVWQGRWATAECSRLPKPGHWHLIGVVVRSENAELWVNGKLTGEVKLTKPIPPTKAPLTFGGVDDNGRIWQNFVGALDEIRLFDKPLDAEQMAASYKPFTATHKIPDLAQPFTLWTGPPVPSDVEEIPFAKGIEHRTIHRPAEDGYKFLQGAAIVEHKGVMYANWANSPDNENGPHETLQGRRSTDGGVTWSDLEVIGPGFQGDERHSHGVLFVHKDELWTICARFGVGTPGRRFPGLQGEAFVLKRQNRRAHLVAFMDDHSRFITSCGLHASQSAALVLEVLRGGLTSYGQPQEILTDNGAQYVTWRGKSQLQLVTAVVGSQQADVLNRYFLGQLLHTALDEPLAEQIRLTERNTAHRRLEMRKNNFESFASDAHAAEPLCLPVGAFFLDMIIYIPRESAFTTAMHNLVSPVSRDSCVLVRRRVADNYVGVRLVSRLGNCGVETSGPLETVADRARDTIEDTATLVQQQQTLFMRARC